MRNESVVGETGNRSSSYLRFYKPLMDRILIVLSLPLTLPLIAFLALAVRLGSPGPAFLRLSCVGADGRTFRQWRLRCVYMDAGLRQFRGGQGGATAQDPRLTPIGAVLMRGQLNLLPQIFNILAGDMALVGPQPVPVSRKEAASSVTQALSRLRPGLFSPDTLAAGTPLSGQDRQGILLAYASQVGPLTDLRVMRSALLRLLEADRPH